MVFNNENFITNFVYRFEVLALTIRQLKEIKEIQIRKEEVKVSLCGDDKDIYIYDPKTPPGNTFRKVAGYKSNSKNL